ncbi:MAG: amidase, partial [Clostridia bacterium]|nr:amidase [Clostridia bacterium]
MLLRLREKSAGIPAQNMVLLHAGQRGGHLSGGIRRKCKGLPARDDQVRRGTLCDGSGVVSMKELWKLSMNEQIEAMRAGTLRVEELTQVYLDRLEKYGGKDGLNVVAQINPRALEEARVLDVAADKSGALFGLPILVKDNMDVAGLYTTAGSMTLRDNLAAKDAPVIANLRKAGAVILGKANMTEFANYTASEMPNGFSSFGGQVIHAYDPARDPSGSSTGSAVAVSAGLCAA